MQGREAPYTTTPHPYASHAVSNRLPRARQTYPWLSVPIMDVVTSEPVRSDVCLTASAPERMDAMVLASDDAFERTPTSGLEGDGNAGSTRPSANVGHAHTRGDGVRKLVLPR